MLKGLKINTAILICMAFLFRLFTLSVGFVSTSIQQADNSGSIYLLKKENAQIDPVKKSEAAYSDIEFSEEDSDDENEHKFHAPLLVEYFYSPVQNSVKDLFTTITPSNKHYAYNSSKRHLEFGVFRI